MKVALCFSGHARFWHEHHSYWNVLLNRYDIDIFVSTWNTVQYKKDGAYLQDFDSGVETGNLFDVNGFNQLYNPIVTQVESIEDLYPRFVEESKWIYQERLRYNNENPKEAFAINRNRPTANLSMWYKREQVMKLKQQHEQLHNFVYDVVILTRTDFKLKTPFVLRPENHITTGPWPNSNPEAWVNYDEGINDWWSYGPSKLMDKYSNLYSNIKTLSRFLLDHYSFERIINPHKLPAFNMKQQSVPYIKISEQHGYIPARYEGLL